MKLYILIELLSVVRSFVAFSWYSSISIFVYGNSIGSGETAYLGRLVCPFATCLCDLLMAHNIYLPFSGVFCGFPGNIRNGWIDGQRFTFDNRIRYSCKKGFERVGPATRYCGEDGRLEGEEPSCEGKWGHTQEGFTIICT